MPRVLTGNKDNIPNELDPIAWAEEVFSLMDDGYSQNDAKSIVAGRYAKAEDQPTVDKMIKESRNKGL
jgi:hypothetical protein